jgi:transcriptional regulator with XRE-family HTH domain
MPRTNPVPPKEVEICHRLRAFRLSTKLSQVAFAEKIGLDSGQLRNYEHARAPLRFSLAKRLLRSFGVNLYWLADGMGDVRTYQRLAQKIESPIPDTMLFSVAFERHLKRDWVRLEDLTSGAMNAGFEADDLPGIGASNEEILSHMLGSRVAKTHLLLPPELADQMAKQIWKILIHFSKKARKRK